ncbi:MAG: DUF1934 domain-containing protein [Clostridiales Family XIII bacterium]|nr:DUF1934 domain-containing protein [Clostridiales Family XIII bacterium]
MKDIILKIMGNQFAPDGSGDTDPEGMEFITEGRFYRKGSSLYLVYEESEFSGMEGCTTSLKITGDRVRMKRYGDEASFDTSIEFEKGKRYNGWYDTPFGSVEMEVLTDDVRNSIKSSGEGSLEVDYHVSLKGLTESRSRLSIEIMQ